MPLNISKLKWKWVFHTYYGSDTRWSNGVLEKRPRLGKRYVGCFLAGRLA